MQGISEGYYDDKTVLDNDECLNQDAINALDNVIEGLHHGQGFWGRLFRMISAATTFYVSMKNDCAVNQFFYDTISYCFYTNQCGGWSMTMNFASNVMPIAVSVA